MKTLTDVISQHRQQLRLRNRFPGTQRTSRPASIALSAKDTHCPRLAHEPS
jgi:hypothetical protein